MTVRIGARIVWNFEPAFDDPHGPGAVRQHRQNRLPVDSVGARNADRDLDLHRVDRQADRIGDTQPIVPERVAQGAHRSLGVIGPADVGSHADLQNHALQSHIRLTSDPA